MSKIEVNAIEPQCGQTLTIGASDTSIAGIGTVNWDTTKKTAAFTAVSGRGYFVDTSSAEITVTLPASPSAGNIVSVSDYNGTAVTNAITLARNGSNINGDAQDFIITKADSAITFVYVDGTVGWTSIQTSNTNDNKNPFIIATGGTITEDGDFRIHTFTGPGTFSVTQAATNSAENTVGYLVVAGGASGGTGGSTVTGGGGGAGGYREGRNVPIDNFTASPLVANAPTNAVTIAAGDYPITVGAGGAAISVSDTAGNPGSNSIFSSITSAGGGGGGGNNADEDDGGSGGGGKESDGAGGSGNTPPVSPPQGKSGGPGSEVGNSSGGGGGAGANGGGTPGGGGAGVSTSITGSSVTRSGGGASNDGSGGSGGGGDAGGSPAFPIPSIGNGQAGTANTGGGGGASTNAHTSGAGGSGIVVIRYKYQ